MDVNSVMNQLRERAKNDAALRKELETNPEALVARETGLPLEEVRQQIQKLNDAELSGIAGGFNNISQQSLNK